MALWRVAMYNFNSFLKQIVTDKITGKSRGMAMIKFSTKEEMDAALTNMNKAVKKERLDDA